MSDPEPEDDRTPEQKARDERERKHFVFAGILIIGVILMLPISGTIYVLLIKLGWVASPI